MKEKYRGEKFFVEQAENLQKIDEKLEKEAKFTVKNDKNVIALSLADTEFQISYV